MQKEIEKLRLHYVPDGHAYQKTFQGGAVSMTPIMTTHLKKNYQVNPMNI